MNILFNIAVSLIASAVIFVGGMNLPASNFSLSWLKTPLLGAFTEITTATNLADFPTTYNANLNKTIEVGTTSIPTITTLAGLTSASSLATIGTIVSGIWNGTVIGVAYNGTGTTSPTSNQVILGNGSSGFKVVSGFGNSGQFLTSGGAATAPTWTTSVIDQAANYTWTGNHTFSATNSTGGFSPIGSLIAYASTTPPTGWLLANGSAVSRTTYANLYAVVGTAYGVGDGSTTFNLPNPTGRMLLAASSTLPYATTLGATGGATTTAIDITNIPSGYDLRSGNGNNDTRSSTAPDNYYGAFTAGSGIPLNVANPYFVVQYIIKY